MISDTTLTNLSNGLGMSAMLLIVIYHFVSVNGKRMETQGGKTITDMVREGPSFECRYDSSYHVSSADIAAHAELMRILG